MSDVVLRFQHGSFLQNRKRLLEFLYVLHHGLRIVNEHGIECGGEIQCQGGQQSVLERAKPVPRANGMGGRIGIVL